MAHYYPINENNYARITSKIRSNIFADDDLISGNVELYMEWNGGYIEFLFFGDAGSTPLNGRSPAGIGMYDRIWVDSGSKFRVDGNGGVYGDGTSIALATNGSNGTVPYSGRTTTDVSFKVRLGTTGGGIFVQNQMNVFADAATSRVKVAYRNSPFTVKLTGSTALVSGQTHTVRVTVDASNVWTIYVDGVEQGSFTDSSFASNKGIAPILFDADTVVSEVKWLPCLPNPATSFEVVNDAGIVVHSGAVASTQYKLLIPDSVLVAPSGLGPYGGYKVRLYGETSGDYGTAKGDCQFVRVGEPQHTYGPKPAPFSSVDPYGTSGLDIPLRAYFGMGCTRLADDDGDYAAAAAYLHDNYVAHAHPSRPRHIIGHFRSLDPEADAATITAAVAAHSDVIDAWEPLNEPMYSSYSGTTWAPKQVAFYDAVKAGDPDAIVLGPNAVAYNLTWDTWQDQFYAAGGADGCDEVSDHGYNCTNGDISLARRMLDLHLARPERAGKPQWQTEQSFDGQIVNECMPSHALRWLAVQLIVQETKGVPLERNFLWYDYSHGYSASNYWQHGRGSNSTPLLVRTMMDELGDRTFASEYDLGEMADFYVAAKWLGADSTSTVGLLAQSIGQPPLRFYMTGAESVVCVDAFGNESTKTRGDLNVVSFPVDTLPTWVRLPAGVELTLVNEWGYGTNLALAGSVASTAATTVNSSTLVDGVLENQYDRGQGNTASGTGKNFATYSGSTEETNTFPITVTVELAEPSQVTKLVLSTPPVWQTWFGAPTDFDIDISGDGDAWTTVHTESPPDSTTAAFVSDITGSNTLYDTWFNPRTVWAVDLPGTSVSHVRMVVRAASWGGHETEADSTAVWGAAWNPLTPRDLRVYAADDFEPGDRQRFNLTVTCSG